MSPIESQYDVRLVTLIGVAIETIQALSLQTNRDPEQILAESLYLVNKRVHETGEEVYLHSMKRTYPLLEHAIK